MRSWTWVISLLAALSLMLPAGQFSRDPQLVDLLLPGGQGGNDCLDQAVDVSPADGAA